MKEFWDQRYKDDEYVYGIYPNHFFKEIIDATEPGELLLPGEGEGRNAVYAAQKGWKVTAVDFSKKGREKALKLAEKHGVTIDYKVMDIETIPTLDKTFSLIAFIHLHLPSQRRKRVHSSIAHLLKPGGKLIMEAFSKKHYEKNTCGPKDQDLLYATRELKKDFSMLNTDLMEEKILSLDEGPYHQGEAYVIRYVGLKPDPSKASETLRYCCKR